MVYDILSQRSGRSYLAIDDVRYFLNLYFSVACNFLPLLAKDYPGNKSKLLQLFREWNDYYPNTIDNLSRRFTYTSDTLSKDAFISLCAKQPYKDFFNHITLRVRLNQEIDEAKRSGEFNEELGRLSAGGRLSLHVSQHILEPEEGRGTVSMSMFLPNPP